MTGSANVATPNRSKKWRTCSQCGREYLGQGSKFCSIACRRPQSLTRVRAAFESGDPAALLAAVAANAKRVGECMEWTGSVDREGYPRIYVNRRVHAIHRLVVAARIPTLGRQPVHHVCANRLCVRPDHLVPVTQAANNAEMLSRTFYEGRIAELEAALHDLDPCHPALRGGA